MKVVKAVTEIDNISSVRGLEKNYFKIYERIDNSVVLKLGLL